jgi:hypothetical protein
MAKKDKLSSSHPRFANAITGHDSVFGDYRAGGGARRHNTTEIPKLVDVYAHPRTAFPQSGGDVARYIGRHGTKRVAKAVLIGGVPPLMLKTTANPGGLPIDCLRRHPRGGSRRPLAVLQGSHAAVLRLQPPRREGL